MHETLWLYHVYTCFPPRNQICWGNCSESNSRSAAFIHVSCMKHVQALHLRQQQNRSLLDDNNREYVHKWKCSLFRGYTIILSVTITSIFEKWWWKGVMWTEETKYWSFSRWLLLLEKNHFCLLVYIYKYCFNFSTKTL